MDYSQLTVIALAVGLIALLLALYLLVRQNAVSRQLNTQQDSQSALIKQLQQQLKQAENQRAEDHARSLVLGKHLQDLQQAQTQLENQLREVKQQDPSMRLYQRATELVKSGASLEEVMQACDLPRAEAELLFSMHRQS